MAARGTSLRDAAMFANSRRNELKQIGRGGSRVVNTLLRSRDSRRTYNYLSRPPKNYSDWRIIQGSGVTNSRVDRALGAYNW
jgi:hypothetical protein